MSDREDVERFLKRFKEKMKVFDVIYVEREKNTQALLELEILPADRKEVLEKLEVKDYCDGPLEETMHDGKSNMWIFGKTVKATEIYIKITMGRQSRPVICISFHPAKYALDYPFK